MPIKYYPFLKCKQFELLAISRLDTTSREKVIPVFDVPANTYEDDDSSIEKKLGKVCRGLHKKNEFFPNGFFIDTFDIDPRIRIAGKDHPYEYLLSNLSEIGALAVIGLDREPAHIDAAINYSKQTATTFAVRLLPEDIQLPTDTILDLADLLEDREASDRTFHVFFDLRNLPESTPEIDQLVSQCQFLSQLLADQFKVTEFVVSGSSMPLKLSDKIKTSQRGRIQRLEAYLWNEFQSSLVEKSIGLGDYCTTSPDYVEVPPYIYTSIMTAKVIYSEQDHFYVARGTKLETAGNAQYQTLASAVIHEAAYRGSNFSHGDNYIDEISNRTGGPYGNPGSWMGTAVNCHLSLNLSSYF